MQIQEVAAFQQSLYDLERIHTTMKAQYEEEIHRLRSLLDGQNPAGARKGFPEGVPPPTLANSRPNAPGAFGSLMPHHGMYDKRRDSDPHLQRGPPPNLSALKPGPGKLMDVDRRPIAPQESRPPQGRTLSPAAPAVSFI